MNNLKKYKLNKFYNVIMVVGTISLLLSCDFGDMNIDPTTLPDVGADLILPSAQAQTARNMGSSGARVSGVVVQHLQGIDAQPLAYNDYLIDENTLDTYWRTGLYAGAMKDCKIIIEKGQTLNIPHYTGIAKILLAVNLGIGTSFWGEIPYSDAFDGSSDIDIEYDSQELIYQTIQNLLDEAIAELNLPPGDLKPGGDDLIYNGNPALWIGTARALKARYYLHLVNVDGDAANKALTALSGGTIFSNEVEPAFRFGATENEANPIALYGSQRPNQLALNQTFLNLLDARNDPRKEKYGVLTNGNYLLYNRDNGDDLFWGRFESPMPLISYSELLFIQAEANIRLGKDDRANTKYQSAVTANLEKVGVGSSEIASYLADLADLTVLASNEEKLAALLEQKYIAMFGQGTLEAWVDYRRTGYPELEPSSGASESFNPTKVIPRRYLYPFSERQTNPMNVDDAINRQGGHLLDNALWAY